jgi:hypothetical protein
MKEGAGMEHVPSGNFSANGAWLQRAVLAHNLVRWTATIGEPGPVEGLSVARTVRTRLVAMPGRLVNRAGTMILSGTAALAVGRPVQPPPRRLARSATDDGVTGPHGGPHSTASGFASRLMS